MAEYILRGGSPSEADYTPYGVCREAFLCKDQECMTSGPRDTGKTLALLNKLHCLAFKYPGAALVIARKQQTDVYSTVLQTFQKKVLRPSDPVTKYGGESPQWFDYPNGSRIWVAGLDKPGKVLSAELDVVYVNQAEELSVTDWMALLGAASGRAGHMPYAQVIGDCNPSSPTHWIRTRAHSATNPSGTLTLFNSRHEDNPDLYDQTTGQITEEGVKRIGVLDSLTGYLKQRWRYGLWVAPEGAIFSVFDETKHKVHAFTPPPLWPRFVGIDPIGARIAAVWVAYDANQRHLHVYREYSEPYGVPTRTHVENILRLSGFDPKGRALSLGGETIAYWVCGQPAERQARLDWRSHGLPVSRPAFSDVWAGIDRIIALLDEGSLFIHDSCPGLLSEIGDYRRVMKHGEPTNNIENKDTYHCLVGDTLVTTDRGQIPLQSVRTGDMALTRKGYRRVLGSACTNEAATVYQVKLSNGQELIGTGEHLVWVMGQGYTDLHSLRYSDILLTTEEVKAWKMNRLSMIALTGLGILTRQLGRIESTTGGLSGGNYTTCIVTSGKSIMGRSLRAIISTILTVIRSIMRLRTCKLSRQRSISTGIGLRSAQKQCGNGQQRFARWQQLGTVHQKAEPGIENTGNLPGRTENRSRLSVSNAARSLIRWPIMATPAFAPTSAKQPGAGHLELTTRSESVFTVEAHSRSIAIASSGIAPVSVVSVTALTQRKPVYNLEVEDTHEFFANGVLVHNCLDALRYACVGPDTSQQPGVMVPLAQQIGPAW